MNPSGRRIVNNDVASGVQSSTEPTSITGTMSRQAEHVNVHSGPEVQHFGHASVGDGAPISDVRDGKIAVPGSSAAGLVAGGSTNEHHHHEHHHHHPHHTPDGVAINDPPSEFVHDGTTYATGASGDSYLDDDVDVRPGLMTRIKEAIPGTREHKRKVEHEGNTAVYM